MAERKPTAKRKPATRPATPRKRGQRRFPIDGEMIATAEQAARKGLNDTEIIARLGISGGAFYQWRNEGEAWLNLRREKEATGDQPPEMEERTRRCVELVEALARGRVRVREEVEGTALAEALGGGRELVVTTKRTRVRIDGEWTEQVETTERESWRAPNAQLLALFLTRRFRHAWGTDAMPVNPPAGDGERDAVQELMGKPEVREAFSAFEEAVGRAQEDTSTGQGGKG